MLIASISGAKTAIGVGVAIPVSVGIGTVSCPAKNRESSIAKSIRTSLSGPRLRHQSLTVPRLRLGPGHRS